MAAASIRLLREVPVPLRDGTILRAEVWLPGEDATRPAILFRTPYGKEGAILPPLLDARAAVDRGYAVVLQDARGCGSSDGVFEPFSDDEADGFDTIAWVAEQPWCDGRVVMAGASYGGVVQWLAAASGAPALRAIAPVISSDDTGEGWSYTSGVPEQGFLSTWSVIDLSPPQERWQETIELAYDDQAAVAETAPWVADWYAAPAGSPYWAQRSAAGRRETIDVPACVIGGWYDIFLAGTLASFARSRDPRDRLVIGPWAHEAQLMHFVGEADTGAKGSGAQMFEWTLDFYDAVLAGRDPAGPRVRAYVLGARRWLELETWPPAQTAALTLALDGGSFTVDPAEPVPSRGGRALRSGKPDEGHGIRDQRPIAARPDVHVVRSRIESDTLLAGPVWARLGTAADGEGECLWTVTLCLEQPDGALHNLCEGVVRADAGADAVEVSLGHVCVLVPAGATLVTLVAGSSFPRWPRPPAARTQWLNAGSSLALTTAPAELLA